MPTSNGFPWFPSGAEFRPSTVLLKRVHPCNPPKADQAPSHVLAQQTERLPPARRKLRGGFDVRFCWSTQSTSRSLRAPWGPQSGLCPFWRPFKLAPKGLPAKTQRAPKVGCVLFGVPLNLPQKGYPQRKTNPLCGPSFACNNSWTFRGLCPRGSVVGSFFGGSRCQRVASGRFPGCWGYHLGLFNFYLFVIIIVVFVSLFFWLGGYWYVLFFSSFLFGGTVMFCSSFLFVWGGGGAGWATMASTPTKSRPARPDSSDASEVNEVVELLGQEAQEPEVEVMRVPGPQLWLRSSVDLPGVSFWPYG